MPLVAWQTSRQHSTYCQVFSSITGVTVPQASIIWWHSSSTYYSFIWCTKSFMYPHRNKSKGVKSGDLGGHVIRAPSPNPFAWKLLNEKGFHWVRIGAMGHVWEETFCFSQWTSHVFIYTSLTTTTMMMMMSGTTAWTGASCHWYYSIAQVGLYEMQVANLLPQHDSNHPDWTTRAIW
jgi:hypothetical protein